MRRRKYKKKSTDQTVLSKRKRLTITLIESSIDYLIRYRRYACHVELGLVPRGSLRIDVFATGYTVKSEFIGVEVKSDWTDLKNDNKIHKYTKYLDRLYLCVTDKLFEKHKQWIRERAKENKFGVLALSRSTGYCYVAIRAPRLKGPKNKYRRNLITKLFWITAKHSKITRPRRKRLYYSEI